MSLRKLLPLVLVPALMAGAALGGDREDSLVREFEIQAGGRLELDADQGGVKVQTWPRNQVRVEIERRFRTGDKAQQEKILKDWSFDLSGSGDQVRVKVERARRNAKDELDLEFRITVPESFSVDLETAGGALEVGDLAGQVSCNTAGGDVELGHIVGTVEARTAGGTIRLESCTGSARLVTSGGDVKVGETGGSLNAMTSGGNIDIAGCDGPLTARTSGGNITVERANTTVELESSGGDVRARVTGQPGDSSIRTAAGNIRLELGSEVNLDLDAKTSGGRIHSVYSLQFDGELVQSHAWGQINKGGPELVLRTAAGNIDVLGPGDSPGRMDPRVQ